MLNRLLKELSQRKSSVDVFNQYQNNCILNNLNAYITYLLRYNTDILLIGEAPGYRGCRLTGIPFTSGEVIKTSKHNIFMEIDNEIMLPQILSENTATILWEFIGINKSVPILWNAFPFHPHQSGKPESNRKPDASEIKEGETYLRIIYDLFKPRKLCSLGRVGESILRELFPESTISYIRHPSYGGKKDFIEGMNKVYDSRRKENKTN